MKNKTILFVLLGVVFVSSGGFLSYKYLTEDHDLESKNVLGEQLVPTENPPYPTSKLEVDKNLQNQSAKKSPSPTAQVIATSPTPIATSSNSNQESNADSVKMQSITNLFESIGQLNLTLTSQSTLNTYLEGELAKELQSCAEKKVEWTETIVNPYYVDQLYQQCIDSAYQLFAGSMQDSSSVLNEIASLSKQAYDTALTCHGSGCIDHYWELVNGFEAGGLVAR